MDRQFIGTIFILFVLLNTCNASLILNIRRLISGVPNVTSTNLQVPPVGSPVSDPVNTGKSDKELNKEAEVRNKNTNSSAVDSKGSKKNDGNINNNEKNTGSTSPPDRKKNGELDDKGKEKVDNTTKTDLGDKESNDSCEGLLRSCRNQPMVACIVTSKNGSHFILVQNEEENNLTINIQVPNSVESRFPAFEVAKHKSKKINISAAAGKSNQIILISGNRNCTLDLDHSVSIENFLQQLTLYSRQVTPIYVAYFFFLLTLLCGGTWACCKLRKRRGHDGIPYQELEMGLPVSSSAVNVETAEGWDQDWDDDDDWDEDNAVRSPGGHSIRNISANGLTSRSSKKDGWDNDWDD